MHEVERFFNKIHIKLTEEELVELYKHEVTDEEIKEAKDYLRSLGFDLKSFCTQGNQWLVKLFGQHGEKKYIDQIRDAAVKIQATFKGVASPFHTLLKTLYGLGFSQRDILFCIWRLGIRGIGENQIRSHLEYYRQEFENERMKNMELIQVAKAEVFQQLQAEVKAAEKRTAIILLKNINILQDELDIINPVDEPTKFGRITKQIEAIERRLNAMHGIDELRRATIDTAAKISILRAAKAIENEADPQKEDEQVPGIIGEAEIISPFNLSQDSFSLPKQQSV
jgi:hypothetical protein